MIGISSPLSSSWVDAIGWMLLHSLWQAAVVAIALDVVLRFLRQAPARARYLAACLAMTLIVALPAASLRRPEMIPSVEPTARVVDPEEPVRGFVFPEIVETRATRPPGLSFVGRLRPMLPTIVGLWMVGTGVFSLRLLGGWILARRWVRRDARPLAGPWIDRLGRLKERMRVARAVRLLESARIEVPMVVGWLRPAILVPVAALSGLSVDELEAILAHELAHIRRHDYLVNMLQCIVETLVFYHPATWWISRVIRREREHCCDDMAVAACRDRLTYARALAAMEGLRAPAFSLSPAANGGILLARVRRILNPQEESMKPVRSLVGLAVVLAVAPIWLARADDLSPKSDSASGQFPKVPPFPISASQERQDPFPNRSFADIVTQVEAAPTGRFMIALGERAAPTSDDGVPSVTPTSDKSRAIGRVRQTSTMFLEAQAKFTQPDGPTTPPTQSELVADRSIVVILDGSGQVDPPSEAEVWAKIPKTGHPPDRKVQRNNIRIVLEKIVDKADPAKAYPLAGVCQLVHKHYKCTVYYDELSWADHPVPFNHVDHKVEFVYIDKDFLRPVPMTVQPADDLNNRLDRISREIEQLKRKRQLDHEEQKRIINRLIKELEDLKHHNLDTIDESEAEKTFGEGVYYKRIGKVATAEFFFGKILRRWPSSPWAVKAKSELQVDPNPASRKIAPPVDPVSYWNFAVGGLY
jgi:beta-lactamase regulating signal transducer with metallopeptidase domain